MIVEVADRVDAELRVLLDLARDERAGVAGAGDQDAARRRGGVARPRPPPFRDDPLRQADPGDAGQRQEPVDREDGSREERQMPAMTPSATRSARMALATETAVATTSRSDKPA